MPLRGHEAGVSIWGVGYEDGDVERLKLERVMKLENVGLEEEQESGDLGEVYAIAMWIAYFG